MNLKFIIPLSLVTLAFAGYHRSEIDNKPAPGFEIKFEEVTIGNARWAASNWTWTRFANGDDIPEARNGAEWKAAYTAKKPVWCHYKFDKANDSLYGKLYNWYAVSDARGLAPKGWRVPSEADFTRMAQSQGALNKKLKSKSGWGDPFDWSGDSYDGDNSSGFNAFPGGSVEYGAAVFSQQYFEGHWWIADPAPDSKGNLIFVITAKGANPLIKQADPASGQSVRLVRNVQVR